MISYQEASRKASKEIDKFDSELLLAFVLKKSREKIYLEDHNDLFDSIETVSALLHYTLINFEI